MARKRNNEGTLMLPGMEGPPSSSLASKARGRTAPSVPRIVGGALVTVALVATALFALHRIEQFLIADPFFSFDDPGDSLFIAGAEHASRRAIDAVFAGDKGRSVYLIPINDRRITLKTIDWVREATVARLWPNRLVVQIAERKPVAFLTLSAGRVGLIDEDGVILAQAHDRFVLPVVTGVHATDSLPERRERISRMLRAMKEIGDAGKNISEIDVADRDNLKIRQPYEGRIVTLLIGDSHFAARYQNFLTHYAEIKRKLPGASTLDLRLEDRITVVE